ncbi:aBC transporter CydDC cysteine exporter (CydDC-E) family permease/ATP-binding protein CydD [Eggerthella sp. CAG:1427]|nr:aBC transporter CydDC cysteine exporter (CydDC-E) family permease/ATP-binding protein CydD [Eggerthella sp. CAG:1427]
MIDRLLFTIKGVSTALRNCVLFSFVAGALIAIQALCLTTALVNLWYSQALLDQIPFIAGFLACLVARQILDNAQSKWLETFAANRADEFREALFEKLFKQGQTLIQQKGTGGFATLLIEGVDQVESYLHMILPRMTKLVIIPVMLLVLLFVFDWVSALIGLMVFPAIILQMVLIGHTASLEAGKQHKEYQRLANHFLDSIRGIDTLKFFGRSKAHAQRIFESSERFRKATMKTLRVATLSGAVLDAFSTVSIAAIAVLLGFRLVDGSLGLYPALFVLVVMPDYFRPIREFASDYHASLDGKNALRSILDTLGANGEISSESADEDTTAAINATAANNKPVGSSTTATRSAVDKTTSAINDTTLSSPAFSLELRDVSFSYGSSSSSNANTFALENISATFFGGQRIGIVGASGSGKSTLAHILAGLTDPTSGKIVLNEQRLSTLNTPWWHHRVAYIPQDPHIFHASLRDNVAFYHPEASDADLEQVCSLIGLNSLIEELPEGINTIIGEGGHTLSGGQAQRIAFARAFLNDECSVLIFDEPTAHLDIETELELKEHMLSLMQNKLVFFATHRMHWLSAMDSVVVLDKGKVVMHNDPSTLDKNFLKGGESHEQ